MPHSTLLKRRTYLRKWYRKNRRHVLANAWGKKNPEARRAYTVAWYAKNKARLSAYQRAYYSKNKTLKSAQAKARYLKNRDKALARSRKAYAASAAAGIRYRKTLPKPTRPPPTHCECCGRAPKRNLHLDHCHATNAFRGWLCTQCNVGLGMLGDDLRGLRRALRYLGGK